MWFSENPKSKDHKRHIFKRDWTMSSNINDYATLNTDYNREDVCINLKNQQTCTSEGGPIFKIWFFELYHCGFDNGT
jgi:hypothetical protein